MYQLIKHIHVTCVTLSGGGFVLRGIWMLSGSVMLNHRLTKVLPHLIDSVLLASAIALAVMIRQYPFVAGWVTAKVLGLLLYVLLGTVALKRGRTTRARAMAFAGALLTFVWIVSVALTKQPAGFFALLGDL